MTDAATLEHFSRAAASLRDVKPFACGNCGERFHSKADKRRHKIGCHAEPMRSAPDEFGDEDAYGRLHITPEIKRRAAAEWAAMDRFGRLPDGWTYAPAEVR